MSKEELPPEWQVTSGCEQLLNCEHQFGAQHIINGDTPEDGLELLQPKTEDCIVCALTVSCVLVGTLLKIGCS